jgi:hypothetical protein
MQPSARALVGTLGAFAVLLTSAVACSRDDARATGQAPTVFVPGSGASPSATAPEAVAPKENGKVVARAMEVWVYDAPSVNGKRIGYLRAGAEVATRGKPTAGEGCPGGFLPIEPQGYLCLGPGVTGDTQDAIALATARRPERTAGLPYGYAVVRNSGAPFYSRIPSEAEARAAESDWDKHFATLQQAEASEAKEGGYPQLGSVPGATFPLEPSPGVLASWATDGKDDPLPFFLKDRGVVPNLSGLAGPVRADSDAGASCSKGDKTCIPLELARPPKRLGISFIASFEADKRRYLLTPDLQLMPADRVRIVRGTSFRGVELGGTSGLELPIIFVTKAGAKRYTLEGKHTQEGAALEFRAAYRATKKQREIRGVRYFVLEDGSLVSTKEAVRLDPIRRMPKWGKEGERWLEINLAKQTLLAVDGEKPVFATLVSTGAGGVAEDTEKNPYVTPRGIFRVHTKHVASTMDSKQPEAEFELRDVPYIQYFKDGYALHAAYWHDQFGMPRSHGCINLAPLDAARLFAFTKPEVPSAWHGAMLPLRGTIVWIHP